MVDEPFVMEGNFPKEFLLSLGFEEVKEVPLYSRNEINHIVPMVEPVGRKYLELYKSGSS